MNKDAKIYLTLVFINIIALVFHIASGATFMVFFTLFWFILTFICFLSTIGEGEKQK